MQFLTALYNSLWNLPWLKDARLAPAKAWGYFFSLVAVFTVIFFIPLAISLPQSVRDIKEITSKHLPAFQADWKDGSLAVSGLQQPYVYTNEDLVVVVDTVSTSTIDLHKFLGASNQKVLLVAKNKMTMLDGASDQEETQDWQKDFTLSFSNTQVADWVASHTTGGYMVLLSLLMVVIIFVSLVFSKLWLLVVVTAFVAIFSALLRRGWRWSDLFVVGLYGMTLPSLISYLIALTGFEVSGSYFMALLAFMLAVAFTNDKPAAAIDFSDESDSL